MTTPTKYDDVAAALVANGYEPLPIAPGTKAPKPAQWTSFKHDERRKWPQAGAGIKTKCVPAADLDVDDEDASAACEQAVRDVLGLGEDAVLPRRIGRHPRVLLPFRCDVPFAKLRSADYKLRNGTMAHVEILCDGQQFVAYGMHATTGKPYTWNGSGDLLSVPRDALPLVDEATAGRIITACEEVLSEYGERVTTQRKDTAPAARAHGTIATGGRNDALARLAGKLRREGLSAAAMEAALQTHNAEHCAPPLSREEVAGIARSVGRYPTAPDAGVHCNDTEDALARAFVDHHGDDFRVCPGLGWMRWAADHWERDDKLKHMSTIRVIARDLGAIAKTNSDNRRLASSKFIMGTASLARVDQRIVHGAEEFDRDPHELNTPAGVVDFRTGTLRPHRRDLMTKATAVAPDFTASRAVWHDFLRSIFADDVEIVDFVRRLLGYSIAGETREQVLAFFFGTGANGKSTLLDVVMELLGSYAIKLPSDSLMAHHGDRHPTDIAQLKGVRLAVSNEIDEGEYWAESKLKELTGDRMLTARFMRGDFFTFQASHKHLIAGNHRPQVRAMDEAMRRRILLIPFGVRFEGSRRDNDLPAKLRAAGPAILADLCEGAAEWYRVGLAVPASIRRASSEYAEAMDSLGNWIAECCTTGEGYDCTAKLLYDSYRGWKEARGEKAVSLTRWGEQMGSRGYEKVRSNGVRYQHIDLTGEARHAVEMGKK